MAPYRYGRIMVTGKYGDGKTSLIQALLGKPIPDAHVPTEGLDAHYSCKVDITKCTEDWSELLIEKKDVVDDRITMGIIRHAESNHLPDKSMTADSQQYEKENKVNNLEAQSVHRKRVSDRWKIWKMKRRKDKEKHTELVIEDDKQLYNRVNKKKDVEVSGNNEEHAVIFLWDFGGQEVYTNLYPIFLRTDCIHIVVYDLEKLENAKNVKDLKNYSDQIEFWLQMIQSNYKRPNNTDQLQNVLLVGTHKDKLKGNNAEEREKLAEQLIQGLKDKLTGKEYKYLIANYFHVDSKGGVTHRAM